MRTARAPPPRWLGARGAHALPPSHAATHPCAPLLPRALSLQLRASQRKQAADAEAARHELAAECDRLRAANAELQARAARAPLAPSARGAQQPAAGSDAVSVEALRSTLGQREAELSRKAAMLAQLGAQLRSEGERADQAEERAEALEAEAAGAPDAERLRGALDEARAAYAAAEAEGDELRARGDDAESRLAEMRAALDAAQAELGALSPEFFDEIEELKFKYAQGAAQLARYERLYGRLPAEVGGA